MDKFWLFVYMASEYTVYYWRSCIPNQTRREMRRIYEDKSLRYEGWLIGALDMNDIPWVHQELAMRDIRASFPEIGVFKRGEV